MYPEIHKLTTDTNVEKCYVHARGLIMPDGFGIMTTQKLDLSGWDVFYGIEIMKTSDGGKTFSKPEICKNLIRRTLPNKTDVVMCDATPFYHKKTGKILLTGHTAVYDEHNKILKSPRPRSAAYSVYNNETGEFDVPHFIELPEKEFFSAGPGCSQIVELENGELLIPIYYKSYETECIPNSCSSAVVLRCAFDGDTIRVLEIGTPMNLDVPRGLDEPSIIQYQNEHFLALRNDITGYVTKSTDGLTFDPLKELCFDDGENLGNYNTQQHWLTGGGKLWLVYTRRDKTNTHIFRSRAPLFIAEFDPQNMCIIRNTEQIAVPERGARLGNFGCQSFSEELGFIYAAEWMQNDPYGWDKCAQYGSDNSIFITKIHF